MSLSSPLLASLDRPPSPPPRPTTRRGLPSEVDVVICTSSGNLDFLETWRTFLMPHHLIIVQDGDPTSRIQIPEGFHYDLYNRNDINRILGPKASCIPINDSACRCFAFLVSKKKYIFTMDEGCSVATDLSLKQINALGVHLDNLKTLSTPFICSTKYDALFPSIPELPTAISHGLWLETPVGFNPTTTEFIPNTRNMKMAMSIPKGHLIPMIGTNLAFNRELIGPAMYFGLVVKGRLDIGLDRFWAGWCAKVICDHLDLAVKWGFPYIFTPSDPASSGNVRAELQVLLSWYDKMIKFFGSVCFPVECTTVQSCYKELAKQVKEKLSGVDPHFNELGDAMMRWIEAWEELNPTPPIFWGQNESCDQTPSPPAPDTTLPNDSSNIGAALEKLALLLNTRNH